MTIQISVRQQIQIGNARKAKCMIGAVRGMLACRPQRARQITSYWCTQQMAAPSCLNLVIETLFNLIFCFAVFDETDRQQFGRRCRRLKQGQGHTEVRLVRTVSPMNAEIQNLFSLLFRYILFCDVLFLYFVCIILLRV